MDHLPADDPAAQRSRRDLVRVHRVMGTRSIVARAWQALCPAACGGAPLRVLELGAGDGTLLLAVARQIAPAWPAVELTLLDRQRIVSPATLAAFAELGWQVTVDVADVLDWAARPPDTAPGAAASSWDLIVTTLFLHHFEGAELDTLLMAIAARSQRFFACEPRRGWLALTGSHLIGAIGANAVTREDAVFSVHAGFRQRELTALWPAPAAAWQSREYTAGLFGHCFSTRRAQAHAWAQ
ncbi:MAG: class I SAM-dependent methyltransferase [Betaproteobacteria bacterium]|nr:class I SAM-dependent methyltransferase [Betaproteobacteria bacterium]